MPAASHGTHRFPRVPVLGARARGNSIRSKRVSAMSRRGPRLVATALASVGLLALLAAGAAEAVLVYAARIAIGIAEHL